MKWEENLMGNLKHVETMKKKLRSYAIESVLDEYDRKILGMSKENQKKKYKKMLMTPFQFFRGSAFLFYFDVMQMPLSFHTPVDKPTWLQGDLHFENFGAFMNEEGKMVYEPNDFDEGYLGSYLHDVLRMAASISLYGEELGYDEDHQKKLIDKYLRAYYEQLKIFSSGKEDPSSFVFNKENTQGPVNQMLEDLEKRKSEVMLKEITMVEKDELRRFSESDKLERLDKEERMNLEEAWPQYLDSLDVDQDKQNGFYEMKDVVKKMGSGTGSIGLQRYYILIEGKKGEKQLDDIVLEAKEAREPVPSHFHAYDILFGEEEPHQGKRVVISRKAMQYLQDPYLGFFKIGAHDFYVREHSPYVGELDQGKLDDYESFVDTVDLMGRVTAKMHARADVDSEIDAIQHESEEEILKAIGGNVEGFIQEVLSSAIFYKNQVHEDHDLFTGWCKEKFDLERVK